MPNVAKSAAARATLDAARGQFLPLEIGTSHGCESARVGEWERLAPRTGRATTQAFLLAHPVPGGAEAALGWWAMPAVELADGRRPRRGHEGAANAYWAGQQQVRGSI